MKLLPAVQVNGDLLHTKCAPEGDHDEVTPNDDDLCVECGGTFIADDEDEEEEVTEDVSDD